VIDVVFEVAVFEEILDVYYLTLEQWLDHNALSLQEGV
jgi:hypothetical protein